VTVAKKEVETRQVVNRIRNADGTITEVTVTEKRLKKQHDSMMRHMLKEKERREAGDSPAVLQPIPQVLDAPDPDTPESPE
jgi:hypothetical protein